MLPATLSVGMLLVSAAPGLSGVRACRAFATRARPVTVHLSTTDVRSRTAICFSGGGSRAYVAALGQLQGLRALGLLDGFGHIAGVSGGAWATAAHCYGDPLRTLPLLPPNELDWAALANGDNNAPHLAVSRTSILRRFVRALAFGRPPYEAWRAAVYDTLLRPLGLPSGACFAWSVGADSDSRIITPRATEPAPHFAIAVLGATHLAPFELARRAFACFELTTSRADVYPRLEGEQADGAFRSTLSSLRREGADGQRALTVPGGQVRMPAPVGGTLRSQRLRERIQQRIRPLTDAAVQPFSLADALAVTSFFPGAPLACVEASDSRRLKAKARRWIGRSWRCVLDPARSAHHAPSSDGRGSAKDDPTDGEGYLLADGGSVTNMPLPMMLAQQPPVTSALCCFNVGEPLPTRAQWEPTPTAMPSPTAAFALSEDLSSLFGVLPSTPNPTKDLTNAQCFATSEFAPLVRSLQAALESGRGAVVTTRLTTVANEFWGIAGGHEVRVTWMYICRAAEWERHLPAEVADAIARRHSAPRGRLGDASRASALRYGRTWLADAVRGKRRSPLDSFPQYPLTRLKLSTTEANALYQLSGWVVKENEAEIRALFR